jgi:hypothetical protein
MTQSNEMHTRERGAIRSKSPGHVRGVGLEFKGDRVRHSARGPVLQCAEQSLWREKMSERRASCCCCCKKARECGVPSSFARVGDARTTPCTFFLFFFSFFFFCPLQTA